MLMFVRLSISDLWSIQRHCPHNYIYDLPLGRIVTEVFHTKRYAIIVYQIVDGFFFSFSPLRQRAHGGCDRLAEGAHSSLARDSTSKI